MEVRLPSPIRPLSTPWRRSRSAVLTRPTGWEDATYKGVLLICGSGIVLLLASIALKLFQMGLPAFQEFGFSFFLSNEWDPVNEKFGALAFLYGTIVSSLLALLISCPISIGAAVFLTELAGTRLGRITGFLVEMLAAIPSVVYGLWGIFVLAPWLRSMGAPYGVGMLAAGIILAIMITPTISTICREVFRSVPIHQKEAALALGTTRWEMIRMAVLKPSWLGIVGAVVLGLGRALGETMAVTMVIGNRADISLSLLAPAQSMASVIANEYVEASGDLHQASLAAIGFGLFLVAFVVLGLARLLVWHVEARIKGAQAV